MNQTSPRRTARQASGNAASAHIIFKEACLTSSWQFPKQGHLSDQHKHWTLFELPIWRLLGPRWDKNGKVWSAAPDALANSYVKDMLSLHPMTVYHKHAQKPMPWSWMKWMILLVAFPRTLAHTSWPLHPPVQFKVGVTFDTAKVQALEFTARNKKKSDSWLTTLSESNRCC